MNAVISPTLVVPAAEQVTAGKEKQQYPEFQVRPPEQKNRGSN
jgi:hypothetical protein